MSDLTIRVHVATDDGDIEAGTLYSHRRGKAESATFAYAHDYLTRRGAYQLEPALPLSAAPFQTPVGHRLFGALADCAPDRWGRTLIKRAEARAAREEGRAARALGDIDYLLGVRDDLRQGALRFRIDTGPFLATDETGVPLLTDLPQLLAIADAAERDAATLPDLRRLLRAGGSLGGARPKAHVRTPGGRVAIAKFPSASQDTWNVMAWEKVALDLARRAGITVPDSELLTLDGRHVLVVDRFDRTPSGRRVGYVSAMTMLEAIDGDQRSYPEIAEAIEVSSSQATRDLAELWRRIVFTVLISNTDDHLRNHGFLHAGGTSWNLSPAFDLNPDPDPGPKELSTAIDPSDPAASLDLALSVAPLFRIPDKVAVATVREVADAVRTWRQVAGTWLSPHDVADMEPAFAALADAPR